MLGALPITILPPIILNATITMVDVYTAITEILIQGITTRLTLTVLGIKIEVNFNITSAVREARASHLLCVT